MIKTESHYSSKKMNTNGWKILAKDIILILIGAIIGFSGSIGFYIYQNKQIEKNLVKILAIDILNNLELAYTHLHQFSEDDAMRIRAGDWIDCQPHDFHVYKTFIPQLTLLPIKRTKEIYWFYLILKRIDNQCNLFPTVKESKGTKSYGDFKTGREQIKYYFGNYLSLIKNGRNLVDYFKKEQSLDISEMRFYFGRIRYFHDEIIKVHPELENKLPERP